MRGVGANAAPREPTITGHPARHLSHSSTLATGTPRCARRWVNRSAQPSVGVSTSREPFDPSVWFMAERTRSIGSRVGPHCQSPGRKVAPLCSMCCLDGAVGSDFHNFKVQLALKARASGATQYSLAHLRKSKSSGGGPNPSHFPIVFSSRPSIATSVSSTHARTERP